MCQSFFLSNHEVFGDCLCLPCDMGGGGVPLAFLVFGKGTKKWMPSFSHSGAIFHLFWEGSPPQKKAALFIWFFSFFGVPL